MTMANNPKIISRKYRSRNIRKNDKSKNMKLKKDLFDIISKSGYDKRKISEKTLMSEKEVLDAIREINKQISKGVTNE